MDFEKSINLFEMKKGQYFFVYQLLTINLLITF